MAKRYNIINHFFEEQRMRPNELLDAESHILIAAFSVKESLGCQSGRTLSRKVKIGET